MAPKMEHARPPMAGVRAVIQAGGRGERLRPLTHSTPKPLLPVAGVPMVERLVRQFAGAGVRRFTVLTAWLGELVQAHLRDLTGLPRGVRVDYSSEEWGLGTTGGLAALAPCEETVVFAFGDLVTDLDVARLVEIHARSGAQVTLASHIETHRVRLGGIVAEGAAVVGYREKPEKESLICSGIAVFEPAVIDLVGRLPTPVGL